jgi:hypothetical protein
MFYQLRFDDCFDMDRLIVISVMSLLVIDTESGKEDTLNIGVTKAFHIMIQMAIGLSGRL